MSNFASFCDAGGVGCAEPEVFGMKDRFIEEARHVVVVERVGGDAPGTVASDESERAQEPELM